MRFHHGSVKPTGLNRTLPNQITREGILGNEYGIFSEQINPAHKTTLPFTPLLAGPADFTPGGFEAWPPQPLPWRPGSHSGVANAALGSQSSVRKGTAGSPSWLYRLHGG